MGFMSGLASGFGTQISAGLERKGVKERDALNFAMERWSKRTEEYTAAEAADKKLQEQAKAIVASNGLPDGAWVDIYNNRLKAGDTFSNAEKWALSQKWSVTDQAPSMPDTPAKPQQAATAQDAQMAESGLVPGQAATPGQTDPGILGSMAGAAGDLFNGMGNPQAQQERLFQTADSKATAAMGLTPDQQAQYTAGYQSNVPTDGIKHKPTPAEGTDAAGRLKYFNDEAITVFGTRPDGSKFQELGLPNGDGTYMNAAGETIQGTVTRALNKDGTARYDELSGIVSEATVKLGEQKSYVLSLNDAATAMNEIVAAQPGVITASSGIASVVNRLQNEANTIFGMIDDAQELSDVDLSNMQSEMEAAAVGNILGTDELSLARKEFESKRVQFVFNLARTLNGPGPLTEGDITRAAQIIDTSDPEEFKKITANLVQTEANRYNTLATQTFESDSRFQDAMAIGVEGVAERFGPVEFGTGADQFNKKVAEKQKQNEENPQGNTPAEPSADQVPTNIQNTDRGVILNEGNIGPLQARVPGVDLSKFLGKQIFLRPIGQNQFEVLDPQGNVLYSPRGR